MKTYGKMFSIPFLAMVLVTGLSVSAAVDYGHFAEAKKKS